MRNYVLLFLVFLFTTYNLSADEQQINTWLIAGGQEVNLPAFANTPDMNWKTFSLDDVLGFDQMEIKNLSIKPGKNANFPSISGKWELRNSEELFSRDGSSKLYVLCAYFKTDRFQKVNIEFESNLLVQAFLNGENKGSLKINDESLNISENLYIGTNQIVLKVVVPANTENPYLKTSIKNDLGALTLSQSPNETITIHHILDGKQISRANISADGKYASINYRKLNEKSKNFESWFEVIKLDDKALKFSSRGTDISGFTWTDRGATSTFIRDGQLVEFNFTHSVEKVLIENFEGIYSYQWSPTEDYIYYSKSESLSKEEKNLVRINGMEDRLPWHRSRSFLYRVHVKSGYHERLTFGNKGTQLHDISPDGKWLIFDESWADYTERPYSKQNLYKLNLSDFSVDTIWKNKRWGGQVTISPDANKLLVLGGPSCFGELGENVSENVIPNNFDNQAYIYDLKTHKVSPITKTFNPTIGRAYWNLDGKSIFFTVSEEDYQYLYTYEISSGTFKKLNLSVDVLSNISFNHDFSTALYCGSSISTPKKAFLLNVKKEASTELLYPEKEMFSDVEFGNNKNWNFTSSAGQEIKGRIYFPPNFDPSKKYPLIVNYYGGTSPVERSFGGRYPLNLYAANGYIVYLLQPSGAIGFGQEFSAKHVNDWGKTTATEIIEGTKKLTAENDFIDQDRIGCIGASYGGFMTMYLQTKTDIFAAAISHAGISALSSYWGEGYWGYSYSAEASAESFPWNNRELYVEQSPLFHADKINTPILLLHGAVDTNVPIGESLQMYAALKLLNKEAELVTVEGQDHHILDYDKRIEWNNAIFAWFDKWLKDEPEFWNYLFPEENY